MIGKIFKKKRIKITVQVGDLVIPKTLPAEPRRTRDTNSVGIADIRILKSGTFVVAQVLWLRGEILIILEECFDIYQFRLSDFCVV